jgi:hypothetical protein
MSVQAKSIGPSGPLLKPPNLPGHPNPPLRHIPVGSCQGPLLAPLVPRAHMERHGSRSALLHPPPLALAATSPRELLLCRSSCYAVRAHYLATRARCPVAQATTPPPRARPDSSMQLFPVRGDPRHGSPWPRPCQQIGPAILGRVPAGSDGPQLLVLWSPGSDRSLSPPA